MCGIAGLLRTDRPAEAADAAKMAAALVHRGPDGRGAQALGPVAISHRRLSIIDPSGGAQPLAVAGARVWITYNGELYNFRELRDELEGRGHCFRTRSDTEVVAVAYREWGDACVERFRGMFAFAVVDLDRRRVFLARDHLGIKPLVYRHGPQLFAFASQIPALLAIEPAPGRLDEDAIDQYLELGYIPAPLTAWKDVRKLPPGHRMAVTFDGACAGPQRYWRPRFAPLARSEAEWEDAVDAALDESVRAHLVADVPYGAFLSGGLDSATVVQRMAAGGARVRAYTIGFDDADHDETAAAAETARILGCEQRSEIVKADAHALIGDLVRQHGEPFGDSSMIPTWHVSRLARMEVPMVLSGDGGDELFAGYTSYGAWMRWLEGRDLPRWKRALRPVATALAPRRWPHRKPTAGNWRRLVSALPDHQRAPLWRHDVRRPREAMTPDPWTMAASSATGQPPVTLAQAIDLQIYLPDDILTKVDLASMAHGLEVRTPLTDVRVAELAAAIPMNLNAGWGADGAWQGKRLLRRVLARRLPAAILDRPKRGFGVPLQRWFDEPALAGRLREAVEPADAPLRSLFRPEALRRVASRSDRGPAWLLVALDEWLRRFKPALP